MNYKDRQWLSDKYVVENLSIRQIASLCNVSAPTIRKWFKKHNIKSRSINQGMKLRSGLLSARSKKLWKNKEYRNKSIKALKATLSNKKEQLSAAAKQSWIDNRPNFLRAAKKRWENDDYRQKVISGLENSWTEERHNKQSEISHKLWEDEAYKLNRHIGLSRVTSSSEFKQKVSNNSKKLWQNNRYRERQAKSRCNTSTQSILDIILLSVLRDRGIDAKPIALGPYAWDACFQYDNRHILIECQGDYWHSLKHISDKDRCKKTYHERHLSDKYELHFIYEYQFYGLNKLNAIVDKILDSDSPQRLFELNSVNVGITDPSTANDFYNKYHYLKRGKGGLHISAKLDNEIIACCTFSATTRKESAARLKVKPNEVLELSRFCIHPSYHKKNFASWLLARSCKLIPDIVSHLIAFSDIGAGHEGTIYKAAGWQSDGKTKPSYWYIDSDGMRYHKKSVWDQAKRIKMSEDGYANRHGLYKIQGKPVLRFVKKA